MTTKKIAVLVSRTRHDTLMVQLPEMPTNGTAVAAAELVAVPVDKLTLHSDVCAAVNSGDYSAFLNLCNASRSNPRDPAGVDVAAVLAELCVPHHSGATLKVLRYSRRELAMLAIYAANDLDGAAVVPPHVAIRAGAAGRAQADQLLKLLRFPLRVRPGDVEEPEVGADLIAATQEELDAAIAAQFRRYSSVYVDEWDTRVRMHVNVLVSAVPPSSTSSATSSTANSAAASTAVTSTNTAAAILRVMPAKPQMVVTLADASAPSADALSDPPVLTAAQLAQLTTISEALFRGIVEDRGTFLFTFALADDDKAWQVVDVIPQPSLFGPASAPYPADRALSGAGSAYEWALEQAGVSDTQERYPAPLFSLLFDPQQKGYHLRAAANIKKGQVVFADEGREFAIVTKPFVEATWSDKDKTTFSEYAWPLGMDGHVYAIWNADPRQWRPINHSCAPNLIFGEGHSLNVIASRDIAAGDDLTLDYATFCDSVMKPFACHCGAPSCRKRIVPDENAIETFGPHSFLRPFTAGMRNKA